MKTLVTGGCGFIGSNLVRELVEKGEDVKVLHLPNESTKNIQDLDVELIAGNVLNRQDVRSAVKGCRKVYHLAAIYSFWLPKPQLMFDVNIKGSKNVFKACRKYDVHKVVYTSSMVRFGGQGNENIGNEDSPFAFGKTGDLYSLSKFQSHELAEKFAKKMNLSIVCPTMPIGPGDIGPTPTGKFMISSMKMPFSLYTDAITNVGDVRDIAHGHVLAMDKGESGRSYILGGEQDISLKKFLQLCMKEMKIKRPMIRLSDQVFEVLGYAMELNAKYITKKAPMITSQAARASSLGLRSDCSRAIEELGYTCRPIEESIHDAIIWFKENGYL